MVRRDELVAAPIWPGATPSGIAKGHLERMRPRTQLRACEWRLLQPLLPQFELELSDNEVRAFFGRLAFSIQTGTRVPGVSRQPPRARMRYERLLLDITGHAAWPQLREELHFVVAARRMMGGRMASRTSCSVCLRLKPESPAPTRMECVAVDGAVWGK
jgi:hypothetical protein